MGENGDAVWHAVNQAELDIALAEADGALRLAQERLQRLGDDTIFVSVGAMVVEASGAVHDAQDYLRESRRCFRGYLQDIGVSVGGEAVGTVAGGTVTALERSEKTPRERVRDACRAEIEKAMAAVRNHDENRDRPAPPLSELIVRDRALKA